MSDNELGLSSYTDFPNLLAPSEVNPNWLRALQCVHATAVLGTVLKMKSHYFPIGEHPLDNTIYWAGGGHSNLFDHAQHSPETSFVVGASYKVMGHTQSKSSNYGVDVLFEKVSDPAPPLNWKALYDAIPDHKVADSDGWYYYHYPDMEHNLPAGHWSDGTVLVAVKYGPYSEKPLQGKILSLSGVDWKPYHSTTTGWLPLHPTLAEEIIRLWAEKDVDALKGVGWKNLFGHPKPLKFDVPGGYLGGSPLKPSKLPKTDLEFLLSD